MKNKQIILVWLISAVSIILVIYSMIYFVNEIRKSSDKYAAEYKVMNGEEVDILSDDARIQIINKYTLVNNDEFSMTALYAMLSEEYSNKFNTFDTFEHYITNSIINNIDMSNDYLMAEKGLQTENNDYIETEYIIKGYTSEEYIKLFGSDNKEAPKVKFSYKVKLIELKGNYYFEIGTEV